MLGVRRGLTDQQTFDLRTQCAAAKKNRLAATTDLAKLGAFGAFGIVVGKELIDHLIKKKATEAADLAEKEAKSEEAAREEAEKQKAMRAEGEVLWNSVSFKAARLKGFEDVTAELGKQTCRQLQIIIAAHDVAQLKGAGSLKKAMLLDRAVEVIERLVSFAPAAAEASEPSSGQGRNVRRKVDAGRAAAPAGGRE